MWNRAGLPGVTGGCVCSPAGTSVLWWLYIDYRLYGNATSSKELKEEAKEEARDNGQALLVYAASATVFTVRTEPEPLVPTEPADQL